LKQILYNQEEESMGTNILKIGLVLGITLQGCSDVKFGSSNATSVKTGSSNKGSSESRAADKRANENAAASKTEKTGTFATQTMDPEGPKEDTNSEKGEASDKAGYDVALNCEQESIVAGLEAAGFSIEKALGILQYFSYSKCGTNSSGVVYGTCEESKFAGVTYECYGGASGQILKEGCESSPNLFAEATAACQGHCAAIFRQENPSVPETVFYKNLCASPSEASAEKN
jgi:hypothetical protein